MLLISDDVQLDRILKNTKLDECELTDIPMEQPDEFLHELMGIKMAPTSDKPSTLGLAPP